MPYSWKSATPICLWEISNLTSPSIENLLDTALKMLDSLAGIFENIFSLGGHL